MRCQWTPRRGRWAGAAWGPGIPYLPWLGFMGVGEACWGPKGRLGSPASPTKTSCGGLKGPSPTALYTLIRISYLRCLFRSVGDSGGGEKHTEVTVPAEDGASMANEGCGEAGVRHPVLLDPVGRFKERTGKRRGGWRWGWGLHLLPEARDTDGTGWLPGQG